MGNNCKKCGQILPDNHREMRLALMKQKVSMARTKYSKRDIMEKVNELKTPREVAAFFGCDVNTVYRAIRKEKAARAALGAEFKPTS